MTTTCSHTIKAYGCVLLGLMVLSLGARPSQSNDKASPFPKQVEIDGITLQQNGIGIRKKWWFPVYQASLYTHHAMQSFERLREDQHPKLLHMVFLRDVDNKSIQEAWKEAFRNNCGTTCQSQQPVMEQLISPLPAMAKDSTLAIWFSQDKVRLFQHQQLIVEINHPAIEQTMLAMFVGERPPTQDLKLGLLGLAEP